MQRSGRAGAGGRWSALLVGACLELPSYAWMGQIVTALGDTGGGEKACARGHGNGNGGLSMFWAVQLMLTLQGTGLGMAYNSISLFVADEASDARLGNALGLVRMGMQLAAMLGQTFVAALIGRRGGFQEEVVVEEEGGGGGGRGGEEGSSHQQRQRERDWALPDGGDTALWLSVLFSFLPVWLCGPRGRQGSAAERCLSWRAKTSSGRSAERRERERRKRKRKGGGLLL